MHIWKKMMACVAAAAIGLTTVTTALAAPVAEATIDAGRTGSMTIYKYDLTTAQEEGAAKSYVATGTANTAVESAYGKYAIPGVEFSYLRVGTLQTRTVLGTNGAAEVELVYGLDKTVVDAFAAIGVTSAEAEYTASGRSYYLSDTLIDGLAGALASDPVGTKNALESYIKGSTGHRNAVTDNAGKIQVSGLELGLYLVVETAVPEDVVCTVDPFFVSLPMTDLEGDHWMYDVTVYPKNQTGDPTLMKEVAEVRHAEKSGTWSALDNVYSDTATASDGDTLAYRVTSQLPVITSAATYLTTYTFADTLSKGLTYKKGDVTLTWYKPDGTQAAIWDEASKMFQVAYANGADSAEIMTISMTANGLAAINPAYSEYTVVIDFEATLNSDASVAYGDKGNPDNVVLTWKRTNMNFEDTLQDDCLVYTYGLDLTKRFQSGTGDYTQVKFLLQNETDGFYVTAAKSEAGVYYVTETVGADEGQGTVFSPASDGSLRIFGLEDDAYVLTETETDEGYVLLKDDIQVQIVSTAGVHSRTGSATVNGAAVSMLASDSSANALAPLTVVNEKGFNLPMTGDNGMFLMPLAGLAGGSALMILLLALRRKNRAAE